jgi:hypothetical protein
MVSKKRYHSYATEGRLGADFPELGVREHLEMLLFAQSMQSYEEGKGRGKHHCF